MCSSATLPAAHRQHRPHRHVQVVAHPRSFVHQQQRHRENPAPSPPSPAAPRSASRSEIAEISRFAVSFRLIPSRRANPAAFLTNSLALPRRRVHHDRQAPRLYYASCTAFAAVTVDFPIVACNQNPRRARAIDTCACTASNSTPTRASNIAASLLPISRGPRPPGRFFSRVWFNSKLTTSQYQPALEIRSQYRERDQIRILTLSTTKQET